MIGLPRLESGRLGPAGQRRILVFALFVALGTVALGGLGIALDERFQAAWRARPWAALSDLVFSAVALLGLTQPEPSPDNAFFAVARLGALAFAFLAAFAVISALAGTLVDGVALWLVGRRGGHAVVVGLGRVGEQLVRDLRSEDARDRGERRVWSGRPRPTVVLEIDETNPLVSGARGRGAIVVQGDARDPVVRDQAALEGAAEIFVACGDDALNLGIAGGVLEALPRAPGASGAAGAEDIGRGGSGGSGGAGGAGGAGEGGRAGWPRLYVHVGDPGFSRDLASREAFEDHGARASVQVFNLWETAARRLVVDPAYGLGTRYAPADDEVPHYVIVGFGAMGRTAALEIARLAHFGGLRRPRMTIVDDFTDPAVRAVRDDFLARHPGFSPDMSLAAHVRSGVDGRDGWAYTAPAREGAVDREGDGDSGPGDGVAVEAGAAGRPDPGVDYAVHAEFLPCPGHVVDGDLCRKLLDRIDTELEPRPRAAIVVCLGDERRNLSAAFRLERGLAAELAGREGGRGPAAHAEVAELPVFVYLPREQGLRALARERADGSAVRLQAFGDVRETAGYEVIVQPRFRQVAVGMGWAYDMATADGWSVEEREEAVRSLPEGWATYEGWFEDDPPWAKLANLGAAAHAVVKLHRLGYELRRSQSGDPGWWDGLADREDEVELLARMEHNRWMAQKLLEGFRYEPYPDGFWSLDRAEQKVVLKEMADRGRRATLRPWEELHPEDRAKDRIQVMALPMILKKAGFRPVPRDRPESPTLAGRPSSPESLIPPADAAGSPA